MGQRGPKPTPTAILRKRGSWRGKANKSEPKPDPTAPECPGWLGEDAASVWDQMIELLTPIGVLTRVDRNALARYCDGLVRWVCAAHFLAKNGEVYPIKDQDGNLKCFQQFPQVSIYSSLSAMLSKFEADFGLTPSARSRIQVPTGGKYESKPPAEQAKTRFFAAGPALKMA